MTYPFKNLIFEGGGVKGIAYVGAMETLAQKGILQNIERVGGTSAGAINAVLFAAGFTNAETKDILSTLNFKSFMDDSWGVVRDSKRLIEEYGWYRGDFFRDWIGNLLKEKIGSKDATFQAVKNETGKDLYVYATNISTSYGEVYSIEHTPRMRVADAVRRSMSIPLFFRAIRDDRDDVFVDGGVLNNYPIKLFDREKYLADANMGVDTEYYKPANASKPDSSSRYIFNKETLGFRLDTAKEIAVFRDGQEPQAEKIDDFFDYGWALINTILEAQQNNHLSSDDWARTVYINTLGVKTTDFDLSDERKHALVQSGEDGVTTYFNWYDQHQQLGSE